jgi:hypothetical protein
MKSSLHPEYIEIHHESMCCLYRGPPAYFQTAFFSSTSVVQSGAIHLFPMGPAFSTEGVGGLPSCF